MELLVVLGGLIALAGLAPRLGQDTRERLISEEERFANLGLVWGPAEQGSGRHHPARGVLAFRHLVASWLTASEVSDALDRGGFR